ncbi:MAG: glycoside hydrolase, partial [Candidatus Methanosuratincola petrocarbonis]
MERFVCIHGHFYQPPRENPWLEEVEAQESARPYHDWNQRVTAECYAPNTASRIIGPDRRIVDIVNNYSMISFNFGPTLLSWMERNAHETYEAILEADIRSRKEFSGHGSAIAQAYSHMIMPLASTRDKVTQIKWGVADFKARFRRDPEGMWLPETAVDTPTLETLAQEGIKFTILAPHQAKRVRRYGDGDWKDARNGALCTNRPYLCRLPSGKTISIFFYNEAISKEVAFGGLLNDGEVFAKRILSGFTENEGSQILSVATDGETYGHHHKFGEMALSYCLHYI